MTFARDMFSLRLLVEASHVCLSFLQAAKMSPRLSISTSTRPRPHIPLFKYRKKKKNINNQTNHAATVGNMTAIRPTWKKKLKVNLYFTAKNAYFIIFIGFLAERRRWNNDNAVRRLAAGRCCIWETDKVRYVSFYSLHGFSGCFTLDGSQPGLDITRLEIINSLYQDLTSFDYICFR